MLSRLPYYTHCLTPYDNGVVRLIHCEIQVGSLCGLHALNNLTQDTGTVFRHARIHDIPREKEDGTMDKKNKVPVRRVVHMDEIVEQMNSTLKDLDQSPFPNHTYTADHLILALNRAGLVTTFVTKPYGAKINSMFSTPKSHASVLGFLLHVFPGHWVVIFRCERDELYLLDSMQAERIPMLYHSTSILDACDSVICVCSE